MLVTPIKFDCCFECTTYSNKHKVDILIQEKLPSNAAWLQARDRMLLPILQRMVLASFGIMPTRWTALGSELPERESIWMEKDLTKRKIKLYFWHLCSMVRLTYEQYLKHDTQDDTFFNSFASTAHSAMRLLSSRMDEKNPIVPMRSPEAMHLWFQIKLVKNEDPVNDAIYNTASRMMWRNDCSMWKLHAQTFTQYGALEYGLALTRQLRQITHLSYDANSTQGVRRAESLGNFEKLILKEIDQQVDRRLILATAIKDSKSSLHILGADMLRLIGQSLWQPEILRWEDVMPEYIESDENPKK